jgi:hypothetical protein
MSVTEIDVEAREQALIELADERLAIKADEARAAEAERERERRAQAEVEGIAQALAEAYAEVNATDEKFVAALRAALEAAKEHYAAQAIYKNASRQARRVSIPVTAYEDLATRGNRTSTGKMERDLISDLRAHGLWTRSGGGAF